MSFFLNLPIGKKLLLAFGLMATLMLILGLFAIYELEKVKYSSTVIVEEHLPRLVAAAKIDVKTSDYRRRQLRMLEQHTQEENRKYAERLQQDESAMAEELERLAALVKHPDDQASIENLTSDWKKYEAQQQQITAFNQQGDKASASKLLNGDSDKLFLAIKEQIKQLIDANKEDASAASSEGDRLYARAQLVIWSLIGASLLIVILAAWILGEQIRKPLQRLLEQAEQVANGDLTSRLDYSRFSHDEIGTLARAFGKMQQNLRSLVEEMGRAVSQVGSATEEVSAIASQSAIGQQTQQNDITYLATAMNEMSSTVNEVARSTTQAANAAQQANREALAGGQIVQETLQAIQVVANEVEHVTQVVHELEQDSTRIGVVLEVIGSIAEQTNLLALNAAIEAARAGEQGRGFAVVADEVRTLAKRTQQSTQEINSIIATLQKRGQEAVQATQKGQNLVELCVGKAAQAGSSIESIAAAVADISDMNTQIATATEEQSSVAEDLNRNIVNINQVSHEIGEAASQTATACKDLSALAHHLSELSQRFRI
ncbi:MAG: methyl-accepting chemotaxis protein [Aeromonadaceae bacterium]|nr:methyl-accepting chemotaxis protein [Aeromonadaceae bacterium]